MQLTPPDYDTAVEGGVTPLEEVVLCRRLQNRDDLLARTGGMMASSTTSPPVSDIAPATTTITTTTSTTTTSTTTTTTTSSYDQDQQQVLMKTTQPIRPECPQRNSTTTITTNTTKSSCVYHNNNNNNDNNSNREDRRHCTCSSDPQILNGKKRKLEDDEEEEEEEEEKREGEEGEQQQEGIFVTRYNTELEKYRKLLLARKRLLNNLIQKDKVPLFYLYGDLLLIPKYKWGSGVGVSGGQRRRSQGDPELNTPIDSSVGVEASPHPHPRAENPSLVQVCPDSQSLEEGGFSQDWFAGVMQPVMDDLNRYGVCVVDNFLGRERAEQILGEVMALYSRGVFHDGQVVSRNVQDQARGIIRGDKITWVTGNESYCGNIGQLVSVVDTLIAKANKHQDAGELAQYNITWRTRAMVACYPGRGSHYVKHVDNPDGDGRCITAIYYINKNWVPEDGGVLRIYPEGSKQVAEIEPVFDRMLFFWSDRRNPHEVLPATVTSRYAITVWYLDQTERERYIARVSRGMSNT